jgi:hypothetical protein
MTSEQRARERLVSVTKAECARRILPDYLREYVPETAEEIDWIALVALSAGPNHLEGATLTERTRAAVAVVAQLLDMHEVVSALGLDTATFGALLDRLDTSTRVEVAAAVTMLTAAQAL